MERAYALRAHCKVYCDVDVEENNGCITEGGLWFLEMVYSLKDTED